MHSQTIDVPVLMHNLDIDVSTLIHNQDICVPILINDQDINVPMLMRSRCAHAKVNASILAAVTRVALALGKDSPHQHPPSPRSSLAPVPLPFQDH